MEAIGSPHFRFMHICVTRSASLAGSISPLTLPSFFPVIFCTELLFPSYSALNQGLTEMDEWREHSLYGAATAVSRGKKQGIILLFTQMTSHEMAAHADVLMSMVQYFLVSFSL